MNCKWIIGLLAVNVFALPPDVSKIFDKSKRRYDRPPSSLRSSKKNPEVKYFSGNNSSNRGVSSNEEIQVETMPYQGSDNLEVMEPIESDEETRSAPFTNTDDTYTGDRNVRRESSLSEYGFSGKRVFGVGFVGAGSYGIFGAEADFGFTEDWSGGFGIGTGMAYSTWGFHARKYFHSGNLTPYFQMGYASWYLGRDPYRAEEVYPIYLGEQFLQDKNGALKVRKRVHLIYPAIGVLFQSQSGLAFSMQLQYLISALDFKGALAGAFGLHFYF